MRTSDKEKSSMILAIDIGNTNVEIGCIDEKGISFNENVCTDLRKTELEYAITIKSICDIYGILPENIEGTIISSVVPPLTNIMAEAVHKITGKNPMIVGPGIKTGLNILLDNPRDMGADLVADAVAGINEYGFPLIIIDLGTAIAMGVIDKKGNYAGGSVMAGIGASLDSLVNGTAQLPNIGLEAPERTIGKNTVDCMKSGIMYGHAAMIDGMLVRIEKELGYPAKVVATGGMAKTIIPICSHDIIIDEELLIKGLYKIYNKNI